MEVVISTFGFIGALLLAICSAPLALEAVAKGKSSMTEAPVFMWIWWWGEILSVIYVIGELNSDKIMLMNYGFNIFCVSIVLYYMYNPRSDSE